MTSCLHTYICNVSNEAGTVYPSRAPEFNPGICGVCIKTHTNTHTYVFQSICIYMCIFFVYKNTHKHIHTSLNWFGNVYSTKIKGKKDKLWSTSHRTLKKHRLHKYQGWTQRLWMYVNCIPSAFPIVNHGLCLKFWWFYCEISE
jgi:hypothetical protein